MSTIRVSVLIVDETRVNDAEAVCRTLRHVAPYCRIQVHTIDPLRGLNDDNAHAARALASALWSDVVLYFTGATGAITNASLIAIRERAGFTLRLAEPDYARIWFTANQKRSLYVMNAFPGAYGVLALALEIGCCDPAAALRVRGDCDGRSLVAV